MQVRTSEPDKVEPKDVLPAGERDRIHFAVTDEQGIMCRPVNHSSGISAGRVPRSVGGINRMYQSGWKQVGSRRQSRQSHFNNPAFR